MLKRRYSVALRVNALILTLVVLIAGGLIASAYWTNKSEVDAFYKDKTSQMTKTLVHFLDGDRMGELAALLRTEKYQALRQQAEDEEKADRVESFLQDHGMLQTWQRPPAGRPWCSWWAILGSNQ